MARLHVLTRSTLDDEGRTRLDRLVQCPADRRCVSIEDCDRCGYGGGEDIDDASGRATVACEREPDHEHPAFGAQVQVVPVEAVASRDVVAVTTGAPLTAVAGALRDNAIGCVIVIGPRGAPVGIVTAVDLLSIPPEETAVDVMRSKLVTIGPMTPITRAAAIMAYEGIHHLPVVNDAGQLVAVLSSLDIMRHLGEQSGYILSRTSLRKRAANDASG